MNEEEPSRRAAPAQRSEPPGPQVQAPVTVGTVAPGGSVVGVAIGRVENLILEPAAAPEPGDPPYKGLDAYGVADAPVFFGREQLTAELVNFLREHAFLAIVGASGSGKSSLARAGVIASLLGANLRPLEDGVLPPLGSRSWRYVPVTPTSHPLEALARGLAGDEAEAATLLAALRADPSALCERAPALVGAGGRLLLLVDQLEELFTLCKDKQEREDYIASLLAACGGPEFAMAGSPCTVVLTVRADFYDQCIGFETLRAALAAHQKTIGPMSRTELRRIIEQPAQAGKWAFQPGLVEQILEDVGDEPGKLPLLSSALLETWKRRSGRVMTLAGYQAAGGVKMALSQVADHVLAELAQRGLGDEARRILLSLVEPADDGRATRRREQRRTLAPDDDAARARALQALAHPEARLVIVDKESVQISHEALITAWPRLSGWLTTYRDDLHLLDSVRDAAQTWAAALAAERENLLIHRGGRLEDALKLRAAGEYTLPEPAPAYLDACVALRDREREAERRRQEERVRAAEVLAQEQQRRAEAEQERAGAEEKRATEQRLRAEEGEKAARGLRWRLILATIAGAIALILGIVAIGLAVRSQYEARHAKAGELAANVQIELARSVPDYSLSLLLAIESSKIRPGGAEIEVFPASFRALAESVTAAPPHKLTLPPHQHAAGPINSIAFSPQCLRPAPAADQPCPRALLTAGSDEIARLWDPETLELLAQFVGHDGPVSSAGFSPDGSQVLTVGFADGTVRVWSAAEGGRQLETLSLPDERLAAGFTADGKYVVTVGRGSVTRVWDVAAGREKRQIEAAAGARVAALSPNGKTLAVVTDLDAASVQLIELTSGTVRRALPINQDIVGLTFTSDGEKIAVHSMAFSASRDTMWDESTLWNTNDGRAIESISPSDLTGDDLWLPDGVPVRFGEQTTAGAGNSDSAEEPWPGVTLSTGSDAFMTTLTATAADSAGGFVAAGGSYGELYVWQMPITLPIAAIGQVEVPTALAFGASDQHVLIGNLDGRLSLWDAITGKQQLLKPFGREMDAWVTQTTLSADGSLAAAVTQGIGLGVWDAGSGQLLEGTKFRESYPDWPDIIRFASGGAGLLNPNTGAPGLLVYGRDTQRIHLYDPRSDTIQATFKGECESPTQMAVSRDGTTLAMDCASKGITVWQGSVDPPTIISVPRLEIKALHSEGLDGSLLLLDSEGWIWKRTQETNDLQHSADTRIGSVYSAAFSPDGSQLAVASAGGVISLVHVASGVTVQTWRHGSAESATAGVAALTFSDDGLTLATIGEDGRARLWDNSPGARYSLTSSELPVALPASYCAQSGNSKCRTVVAAPQNARLFTWETSASLALAPNLIPISRTLRISRDGRYAVIRSADKRLCIWTVATVQEAGCLLVEQSPAEIRTMSIGGSEPTLATWDGSDLRLWRLPDFDLERSIPVSADKVSLVALSPAAPILAVIESGADVKLWDIGGGEAKLLHRLPSPLGDINGLAFSPDGGVLWMASGGKTSSLISRWQVATGQESPAQRLRVDTGVTTLTVSPMGDRLAAGGADGMIYLWDAVRSKEIGRLNAGGVTALAFNGDGRVLFSAEERNAAIQIWPLDLRELLDQAEARIARDPPQLTGAERRRYGLK